MLLLKAPINRVSSSPLSQISEDDITQHISLKVRYPATKESSNLDLIFAQVGTSIFEAVEGGHAVSLKSFIVFVNDAAPKDAERISSRGFADSVTFRYCELHSRPLRNMDSQPLWSSQQR